MSTARKDYLRSSAANAHGHDEVFVGFPALLVRFNHLGDVVVGYQRRVDKDKWVLGVEHLQSVTGPGVTTIILTPMASSSRRASPAVRAVVDDRH